MVQTQIAKESLSKEEQDVIELINVEREKAGLSSLKVSQKLQEVAKAKAEDMGL